MKNFATFEILSRTARTTELNGSTKFVIAANDERARQRGPLPGGRPPLNEVTVFEIKDCTFIRDECSKGDLVLVGGRLRLNSCERNGERAYTVDLIALDFGLLAKANPLARASAGAEARGHRSSQFPKLRG